LGRGKGDYIIYVAEFGESLSAGKLFAGEGRTGFEEEGGEVAAVEMCGQGLSQDIEGGGKFFSGECLVVLEGAKDGGFAGEGDFL
jgi:hypothetical protein